MRWRVALAAERLAAVQASHDREQALQNYEEAATIEQERLKNAPNGEQPSDTYSTLLYTYAILETQVGKLSSALQHDGESVDIRRKLASAKPADSDAKHKPAQALGLLGRLKFRNGDTQGALATDRDGLAIAREFAAAEPQSADTRWDVIVCLYNLAEDGDDPLARLQEGLDLFDALAKSGRVPPDRLAIRDTIKAALTNATAAQK